MLETTFNFAIAIGGAVLLFQFVMMLLGLGHHGHDLGGVHHVDPSAGGTFHDGDISGGHVDGSSSAGHDGAGHQHETSDSAPHTNWFYEIISIRTLSAGATFYGLIGKAAHAWGYSNVGSFLLAGCAGFGAMYGVYWLFKQVYRMQHSGTENIRNAVGAPAVVYVPIPAKRAGAGKVTFKLQDRVVEYLAVTDDENRLVTGEKVVVDGIVAIDTVRVARPLAAAQTVVSSATMAS